MVWWGRFARLALTGGDVARRCAGSGKGATQQTNRLLSFVRDNRGYEHFSDTGGSGVKYHRHLWFLGGSAVVGSVYYYRSIEEIPYTHRRHAIFISPQHEITLGQQVFAQVKEEARAQGALMNEHSPQAILVRRVGQRIAAVAADGYGGGRCDHLKNVKWEFAVINSNEANAFVVPGGKVVVYTGLLRLLKTEDELAAVVAHEAAHVLARHQGERMSQMSMFSLIKIVMWLTVGINIPTTAVALGFFLPHSRKAETEADLIGIRLMARACYDPAAAITMLQKLHGMEMKHKEQTGADIPAMLRTHPLSEDRVAAVRKNLPDAMRLYELSDCNKPVAVEFLQNLVTVFR